jgi:hypothetical protein
MSSLPGVSQTKRYDRRRLKRNRRATPRRLTAGGWRRREPRIRTRETMSTRLTFEQWRNKVNSVNKLEDGSPSIDITAAEMQPRARTRLLAECLRPSCGHRWMTRLDSIAYIHSTTRKPVGCPACFGNESFAFQKWIDIARELHGNRFDYSEWKDCVRFCKSKQPTTCNECKERFLVYVWNHCRIVGGYHSCNRTRKRPDGSL